MSRQLVAAIVLARVAGACVPEATTFPCDASAMCTFEGRAGTCEPTGFCSFSDPDCPSGRRYGEWGGDGVAGACVTASPNQVDNAGCEEGTLGWRPHMATVATSTESRGGTMSCLVCAGPGETTFALEGERAVVPSPGAGQAWAAQAHVKALSGASAPQTMVIRLKEGGAGAQDASSAVPVTSEWKLLSVEHTIQDAGQALHLRVIAMGSAGDCVLVDDLSVVQLPYP